MKKNNVDAENTPKKAVYYHYANERPDLTVVRYFNKDDTMAELLNQIGLNAIIDRVE